MDKTLTVPPNLVRRVREGTYGLLVVAAEAIVDSAHVHEPPEPMTLSNLKRAMDMLDRLGWTSDQDTGQAIELDPEHDTTLHAAIDVNLPLLAKWLGDLDPDDPSRPARAEELNAIRQFAIRLRGERGGHQ